VCVICNAMPVRKHGDRLFLFLLSLLLIQPSQQASVLSKPVVIPYGYCGADIHCGPLPQGTGHVRHFFFTPSHLLTSSCKPIYRLH
jgi:hypothetical protein